MSNLPDLCGRNGRKEHSPKKREQMQKASAKAQALAGSVMYGREHIVLKRQQKICCRLRCKNTEMYFRLFATTADVSQTPNKKQYAARIVGLAATG
jgi:hypothetical protein